MLQLQVIAEKRLVARKLRNWAGAALTLAAALAIADATVAADGKGNAAAGSPSGRDPFWTAARLRDAKPRPLPGAPAIEDQSGAASAKATGTGPSASTDGRPPMVELPPAWNNRLFEPAKPKSSGVSAQAAVEPQAKGSSGFPFTTSRVFPDAAVTTYPYRAAGKLFGRDPRTNTTFVCSAAVIAKRLIGTAGHCVYDTAKNYFLDKFLFVPAFKSGAAPYGSWDWAWVYAANTWINANGSLPNNGDFAIIELTDETVGGRVQKLGDVTGWLGWQTAGLVGQHVRTLGYPTNIDNGQRMEETNAEVRSVPGFNAGQLGSDQRNGSSGGPWIRDFGVQGSGDPTGTSARNRIVGYTSYGPTNLGPRYQGASILNSEWQNMYNQACRRLPGNC